MRYILLLMTALFVWNAPVTLKAQVRVNLNINVGNQPAWGPTGYDYVEYYYLPDIEVYYSVPAHRYYYNNNGRWISSRRLPLRYHYDIYNSYKVVVNEREPWRNHDKYRVQYSSYKNRHDQQIIRDSRDSKYLRKENRAENKNIIREQRHDNGNHFGQNIEKRENKNNENKHDGNNNGYKHDNGNRHKNN